MVKEVYFADEVDKLMNDLRCYYEDKIMSTIGDVTDYDCGQRNGKYLAMLEAQMKINTIKKHRMKTKD